MTVEIVSRTFAKEVVESSGGQLSIVTFPNGGWAITKLPLMVHTVPVSQLVNGTITASQLFGTPVQRVSRS